MPRGRAITQLPSLLNLEELAEYVGGVLEERELTPSVIGTDEDTDVPKVKVEPTTKFP